MTQEEQQIYLSNVVYVAKADEVVDIAENLLLQEVARAVDAPRAMLDHLLAADREAMTVDLRGLGRYSQRVACLEHMIELAMVDDEVALNEKKVLLVAAQQANIARDVVALLVEEARQRRANRGGGR